MNHHTERNAVVPCFRFLQGRIEGLPGQAQTSPQPISRPYFSPPKNQCPPTKGFKFTSKVELAGEQGTGSQKGGQGNHQ